MKKITSTIFIFLIISSFAFSNSENSNDKTSLPPLEISQKILAEVVREQPIARDSVWDKYFDRIIVARGYVQAVEKSQRYTKKYRIVMFDDLNNRRLSLKFHVYTDSSEYMTLLSKGDLFEFKGQFVMYTPINTKKDAYVIDVVLQDGALVVE